MTQTIIPTDHEKREWSRLAQAAYRDGWNEVGHTFSAAGALRHGEPMSLTRFDLLQEVYREWLVFGRFAVKGLCA